jgi:signal transduction histidine kinase
MDAIADHMRAAPGEFNIHDWAGDIPLLAAAAVQGAIIGPYGVMLSTTMEAHPAPIDLSDREHFRVHLDGTFKGIYVSRPLVGRVSGQTVLQVSRRVDAADGTFLGVVVISLAPGQLTALHRTIDLGPRGRMTIVGTADDIVRARFGSGSENGDAGAGEIVPPPPSAAGADGPVQFFIRESVIDRVKRLYSVRNVPDYPLRVAVALDLGEIVGPAAAHARLIMATGIIASLMLVGLLILLIAEIRRRTDREVKLGDERVRLAAEIQQGRQIQRHLRSSEARLRDFAEMASDWFWEQDADLRFIPVSAETPALAADDQSYIGKRRWDINDISQAPEKWADHQRDLMERKPFRDFRFSRPGMDGVTQHVSINGVPVFDVGYRGTGRDISARVEAGEELRRSKEQAEAANRAKTAFLATMSHELRTPLNAIIGFAELIHARKTGRITEEYVEWAGDILAGGRHLLDLINDVLELSRIDAGRYDLMEETIDLGALTRACLPMIRRQAERNRVRIDCAAALGEAVLRADRRAVKQVVLNLLTNAVKFTPAGGLVTIRVQQAGSGEVCLLVEDTGIGIEPEALSKLCKPFIQADASTSRRYGGTGLGLAISSKLMHLHGGTLTIDSEPGTGTTVWIAFPASRVLATVSHAGETV